MKRLLVLLGTAGLLLLAASCAGMQEIREIRLPPIDPPRSEASSLLAVELIAYTSGQRGTPASRYMHHSHASGFYPVVIGPGGREVDFTQYDPGDAAGMIYYRENLQPGVYILIGFRYHWMSRDDIHSLPESSESWRYARLQHQDLLPLRQPVHVYLTPGRAAALGRYTLSFSIHGRGNDYYRLTDWRYRRISPDHDHVLRIFKDWHQSHWSAWNARNPARAYR